MSVRVLVLNDPHAGSDVPTEQLYSSGRLCPDPGITVIQNEPASTEIGRVRVIVSYFRVNAILHTDLRTRFVGTPVYHVGRVGSLSTTLPE